MSYNFKITNQEELVKYLKDITVTKLGYDALQVNNEGFLENTHFLSAFFEKLKGFVTGGDRTNKHLVEYRIIELIAFAEENGFIDKKVVFLIEDLAARAGLTLGNSKSIRSHYELYSLVKALKDRLFDKSSHENSYLFVNNYLLNHGCELSRLLEMLNQNNWIERMTPRLQTNIEAEESADSEKERDGRTKQELSGESGLDKESKEELPSEIVDQEQKNDEISSDVTVVSTIIHPSIGQLLDKFEMEEDFFLEAFDEEQDEVELCYAYLMDEEYSLTFNESWKNGIKQFVHNFLLLSEGESFFNPLKLQKRMRRIDHLDFNNAYALLLTTYRLACFY